MAHSKKCDNCGHKIKLVDGKWVHQHPHPEHVCRCDKPVPWQRDNEVKRTKILMNCGGTSQYRGYCQKEGVLE